MNAPTRDAAHEALTRGALFESLRKPYRATLALTGLIHLLSEDDLNQHDQGGSASKLNGFVRGCVLDAADLLAADAADQIVRIGRRFGMDIELPNLAQAPAGPGSDAPARL